MRTEFIPSLLGYYTMACGVRSWSPGPLIVGDSFTDDNGTDFNGRTPDVINTPGNTWSGTNGQLQIQSNKIVPTSTGEVTVKSIYDLEVASYLTKLTYYHGQTTGASMFGQILFRYQDATHFIALSFGVLNSNSIWKITTANGGSYVDIDTDTFTFAANTPYAISLQASGNDFIATVNGGTALSATSSLFAAATSIGLLLYQSTTITNKPAMDDFQAYTL